MAAKKKVRRKKSARAKTAAKKNSATQRPRQSDEMKKQVVDRLGAGETAVDLSKELGVSQVTIGNWKRKFAGGGSPGRKPARKRGRKPAAASAPSSSGTIVSQMDAKLRQIESLKKEIRSLAEKL